MNIPKIKFFLIFHLIVVFPLLLRSQTYWETLNSPVASRYDDIFFLNENDGFAVNSEGAFLKTIDGGITWQIENQFDEYLRCIEFIGENLGFVGSLDSAFYKTNDGGTTFTNIANQLNTPFSIPGICAISIVDSTIYAGGKWSGPGYVVKSKNGGKTWDYINIDSLCSGVVELDFITTEFGFAAGKSNKSLEGGVILKTEDGGASWKKVATTNFPNEYVWKISQIKDSVWAGSIQGNPASKALRYLKSENYGESWNIEQVIDTFYQSQTIGFLNENYGVVGGLNQLFQTIDGGKKWQKTNFGSQFNRFYKVNDSTAFLSGAQLYKYTNKPIGINKTNTINLTDFKVIQANQQLSISIKLPKPSHIIIDLVDVSGRVISAIENSYFKNDEYSRNVGTSNFKSGFYFVILHTNYGTDYKQLWLNGTD